MRVLLLFLLSIPLWAQTGLYVVESSIQNTGAAFCYIAPDDVTPYSLEVATDEDFLDISNDFNGNLFSGAAVDLTRPDIIINTVTHERCVQFGHTGHYFPANTGSRIGCRMDRVAEADRTYYIRVNGTATTSFHTANIGTNIVSTQGMPIRAPFVNDKPSFNPFCQTSFRDAITGAYIGTLPGLFGLSWAAYTGAEGIKLGGAEGTMVASSGTLPSALALDDGVYAQTAVEGNSMFVSWGDSDTSIVITAASATNPMVLTLATPAPDSLYVNQTVLPRFMSGTGTCSSVGAAYRLVTAVSGSDVTIDFDGTGCTYTPSSGSLSFRVVPWSSSFGGVLSFHNLLVTGDCSGCGSDAVISVCVTATGPDGDCISPTKTFTLNGTETEVRVCNPYDSAGPCPDPLWAGDLWTYDVPDGTEYMIAKGRVWNGATGGCSGGTMLCFTIGSECEARHKNDSIYFWQGGSVASAKVRDTDCGNTPPRITMDDAWIASGNGSDGIPFRYQSNVSNNYNYGYKFIVTDLASGTVRIDQLRWVAASYYAVDGVAHGSGGFPPRCQVESLRTPDGRIFCSGNGGFWTFKEVDGELDAQYMGTAYLFPPGANAILYTPETFTWSESELGVFYIFANASSGTSPLTGQTPSYLYKVQFNTPDIACGDEGTTCDLPALGHESINGTIDATYTNLTPCLSDCNEDSEDYTLGGQLIRLTTGTSYDPDRFGRGCGLKAVQGEYIICEAREGNAGSDTFAWYFALALGNGGIAGSTYVGPGGAQQMYRYLESYAALGFRWAGDHTHSPVLGSTSHTIIEASGARYTVTMDTAMSACTLLVSCDPCPTGVTVNGWTYTGELSCTEVDLSSIYPSGGQPQPMEFESGDPINSGYCVVCSSYYKWLQKLEPGDRLVDFVNNEVIQVVQKDTNQHIIFERGCSALAGGSSADVYVPKAHAAGWTWLTMPVASDPICSQDLNSNFVLGMSWDWIGERTCWNMYVNHAFTVPTARINGGYSTQIGDYTDWDEVCTPTPNTAPVNFTVFTGENGGPSSPNATENHPGYQNYGAATGRKEQYVDAHPLSTTDFNSSLTHVSGDLYYIVPSLYDILPKLFVLGLWQATLPFQRAETIDDTIASSGTFCINPVTSGCFSGSVANRLYVNGPLIPAYGCVSLEFYFGQMDVCWLNSMLYSASASAQQKLPPDSTTSLTSKNFRRLSSDVTYRAAATANVKILSDGKFLFHRNIYGGSISPYLKIPLWPEDDGLDDSNFIPRIIDVDAGDVPMASVKARMRIGYDYNEDENTFPCNDNSVQDCWVVEEEVDPVTPFLLTNELSASDGVPCVAGVGCTIEFPQIRGRVARYQIVFVDGDGDTVGSLTPSFELGAVAPFITTSCPLPDGTQNVAYSDTMTASGTTPITWSISSGTLPTGLSLASNGALTGTPSGTGLSSFTLQADNDTGMDTKMCSLTINAAPASGGVSVSSGVIVLQ